jgi:hypothetical protein
MQISLPIKSKAKISSFTYVIIEGAAKATKGKA